MSGPERSRTATERRRAAIAIGAALLGLLAGLSLLAPPWQVEGGPAFFAHDRTRDLLDNVEIGLWYAGVANVLLLLGLLATIGLWVRPVPARALVPRSTPPLRVWAGLIAIALLAVGLRLPLASRSLWWDEAWTIRQVVVGHYQEGPEGRHWAPGGLTRALWYAKKPTNHALYSVAAIAPVSLARALRDGPPQRFDELAYRAPALVASALTVVLLGLLVHALGFPHAALLAAALLAIHPWHVRYGAEGRAYSFVMMFSTAGALALLGWLRSGRWRELLAYGATQFLLLWTWFYAAFLTASLGLAALLCIARGSAWADRRAALTSRFVVGNGLAGMAFFQVFAPNLTLGHLWDYEGRVSTSLLPLLSGLTLGMRYETHSPRSLPPVEIPAMLDGLLWQGLGFVVLPLLVVVGLVVVWRRSVAARSVLFGWALAGPLSIAVTGLLGRHFFPRFEVFLLPLVVLTVAIACVTLSERLFAQRPRAAGLAPWLLLAAFGAAVAPQLRLLLTHPYAPLRDVARRVSADPDTLRVGYGFGTGVEHVYDPEVRYAGSAKALRAACREAHASGRPFLAFYGYPQKNLRRGDGVALLEDPREFALTDEFVGIDPDFRYRVFEPVRAGCSPRE